MTSITLMSDVIQMYILHLAGNPRTSEVCRTWQELQFNSILSDLTEILGNDHYSKLLEEFDILSTDSKAQIVMKLFHGVFQSIENLHGADKRLETIRKESPHSFCTKRFLMGLHQLRFNFTNALPDEMKLMVFEHLHPIHDIPATRLSCREWLNLLNHTHVGNRSDFFAADFIHSSSMIQQDFMVLMKMIRSLYAKYFPTSAESKPRATFEEIITLFRNEPTIELYKEVSLELAGILCENFDPSSKDVDYILCFYTLAVRLIKLKVEEARKERGSSINAICDELITKIFQGFKLADWHELFTCQDFYPAGSFHASDKKDKPEEYAELALIYPYFAKVIEHLDIFVQIQPNKYRNHPTQAQRIGLVYSCTKVSQPSIFLDAYSRLTEIIPTDMPNDPRNPFFLHVGAEFVEKISKISDEELTEEILLKIAELKKVFQPT